MLLPATQSAALHVAVQDISDEKEEDEDEDEDKKDGICEEVYLAGCSGVFVKACHFLENGMALDAKHSQNVCAS